MKRYRVDRSQDSQPSRVDQAVAFTVIELLVVIVIIATLSAILVPTVASARLAANKAKSRVRFSQWAMAITAFRSEYGYYPQVDGSGKVNGGATEEGHPFHDALAGRKRDGSALDPNGMPAIQNRKRVSFHSFSVSEFTDSASGAPDLLCDAFGTTDVAVVMDRNLDGIINTLDYGESLPAVNGVRPGVDDFPAAGVRAGVVFYCTMPGSTTAAPQFVFSWK